MPLASWAILRHHCMPHLCVCLCLCLCLCLHLCIRLRLLVSLPLSDCSVLFVWLSEIGQLKASLFVRLCNRKRCAGNGTFTLSLIERTHETSGTFLSHRGSSADRSSRERKVLFSSRENETNLLKRKASDYSPVCSAWRDIEIQSGQLGMC